MSESKNDDKKSLDALAGCRTGSDVVATGVTPEKLQDLVTRKAIGDAEVARLRQLLSTDDRGFWAADIHRPKNILPPSKAGNRSILGGGL